MSLNEKDASTDALASQQALANIAALAQIDEAQNQLQHFQPPPAAPTHNFGRQFSFPPEQACHPPPSVFGRANQNPMSAYGYENSWKNGGFIFLIDKFKKFHKNNFNPHQLFRIIEDISFNRWLRNIYTIKQIFQQHMQLFSLSSRTSIWYLPC